MFFMHVLMFFYKSEKHVFLCFFLNFQINVFNIYGSSSSSSSSSHISIMHFQNVIDFILAACAEANNWA